MPCVSLTEMIQQKRSVPLNPPTHPPRVVLDEFKVDEPGISRRRKCQRSKLLPPCASLCFTPSNCGDMFTVIVSIALCRHCCWRLVEEMTDCGGKTEVQYDERRGKQLERRKLGRRIKAASKTRASVLFVFADCTVI